MLLCFLENPYIHSFEFLFKYFVNMSLLLKHYCVPLQASYCLVFSYFPCSSVDICIAGTSGVYHFSRLALEVKGFLLKVWLWMLVW